MKYPVSFCHKMKPMNSTFDIMLFYSSNNSGLGWQYSFDRYHIYIHVWLYGCVYGYVVVCMIVWFVYMHGIYDCLVIMLYGCIFIYV